MYNKSQLSRDRKAAKEPKKIARPKDKFVIPGAPKIDPNGYWDPANVGRIIEVPLNEDSRSITMSYPDGTPLDQPLIGIGTDTGMMQYMMPGGDYIFPYDSSVIEGSIMEAGGTIMDLTDDEIKMYRDAGYVVDLTPYPERHNPANAFSVKDPRSMQPGGGVPYKVDPNDPYTRIYSDKRAYELAKQKESDSTAAYNYYKNNRTPPAFTYDERNWIGMKTGQKVKPKPSDIDVQHIPSVVGAPAVRSKYGWQGITGNSNPYDDYDYKCYEGDPRCNEKGLVNQYRGIKPSGYDVIDWTYPTGNKSRAVVSVFDKPKIHNIYRESPANNKSTSSSKKSNSKSNKVNKNNLNNIDKESIAPDIDLSSSNAIPETIKLPTLPVKQIPTNREELEPIINSNDKQLIKRYNSDTGKWVTVEVPVNSRSAQMYQSAEEWRKQNPQLRESSHEVTPEELQRYKQEEQRKAEFAAKIFNISKMQLGGRKKKLKFDTLDLEGVTFQYGGIPKAQKGSAVPTRADSLELYKQSLYLDKWMKENKYRWDTTHLKKHSPHWIGKDLLSHLKAVYNQDKAEKQKSKPFSAYVKTKGNLIGTSDWIAGGLEDYGLPFTWKHPYIAAQYEGDMVPMENTGPRPYSYSFRYDPVAIKPGDMLTDEEVKKRVKKYGTKGIPESKLEKLGIINKPKSNVVKVNNPSKVNIETNQVDENGNVVSSQEYYDFPPITMPTRKAQTIDVNTPLPEIATNEQTIIKRYDPEQNKWIIDEVNTTDPSVKEYQDAVNWARKNPQKRKSSLFITPEEYAEYQNAKKRKAEIAKQFLKGMATGGTIMDLTDDQIKMYRDAGYVIEDMPSAQNGQTTSSPMSYFDRMQPYTDRFGNPIDLDKLKLQEGPVKFNYNEKTGIIQTNEGTFTPEQYIKEITPEGYSIAKIKSDFGENRYKYYYIGPDYEEVNKNLKMYSKGKETYPIYSNVPYDKRIQQWRAEDAAEEVPTQRTGGYVNKQITHFQDGGFTEKDRLKQKLLNRYPGFKKALGTEGENLHIIADPNFKAGEHGYGDIEVMFPDVDQIDYTSDYTYKSPFPGDYVIPYNPNSSINKGDIFLDMLHLLKNDKGIEPYINKFRTAAIDQRGGDLMWAWEEEKQNPDFIKALESSGTNAFDQFEKNYIDGLLRSELSRLGMGRRTTDEGYKIERSTNSPEMRRAAKDIYKYLKTKQDGGNTDPGNNALELHMFYDKNKFQNGGTNILQTSNSPLDLFKANEFKPFIEDQPYTFAGRPGSYYKMVNGKMQIKNKDTNWKYVEMKDPTGKRYKTLLAGLESGSTKAYKPTTTINDFYYSKNELKKQQVRDRAVQCLRDTDGNCLGSAFLYYDKYVAPNLGLKSSWELKEEAGLTSGKKGNPNYRNWGESIDSWELRGAFGDKAKQFYAAPLDNQYELYDKLQGMTDAEKDKYFRDMNLPIGTIIQGGFEGYDEDREMPGQSYNEEKGYVPSHHSGIVVGYDEYGTPIIYDYGGVRKITDPMNLLMDRAYAINNIYAPNQNVQQTYEYLKKGNKLRQNVTPLNIEIPGIGLLSDINEMQPFIDQLKSNKQALMDAFNLTDSEYNELSKIATATALAETKGGQDLGTFRYGIPTYLTDKMRLGESQGITQINPASVWAKTDKGEWRDPGLVNRLKKLGITEDTYDPWNSKHQAIVTIGLTNSNLKTAKENASINPNVSKDLTDAELAYYQWNIPSALTTNDYEKAARGENENVKRYMNYYNIINTNKQKGGSVRYMSDDEIQKYRDAGYVVIEEPGNE